jgi:hypothetical protein
MSRKQRVIVNDDLNMLAEMTGHAEELGRFGR